jgi:hypothetical protein
MSLVGVGHSGSDPIVPLVLRTVCCAMAGALALYYRFIGTASTLLRRGNISGRPCMRVMTYKALSFPASKQLGSYRRFYTIRLLKILELMKWCISGGKRPHLIITRIACLLLLIRLMLCLHVGSTY